MKKGIGKWRESGRRRRDEERGMIGRRRRCAGSMWAAEYTTASVSPQLLIPTPRPPRSPFPRTLPFLFLPPLQPYSRDFDSQPPLGWQ